jgi:hypothetical protein
MNTNQVESMQLWFSQLTVAIRLARSTDFPLRLDTTTDTMLFSRHDFLAPEKVNQCTEPDDGKVQVWQGFTYVEVYRARYQRAHRAAYP